MNHPPFRHFAWAYFTDAASHIRTRTVKVPRYGAVTQDGFRRLAETMGLSF